MVAREEGRVEQGEKMVKELRSFTIFKLSPSLSKLVSLSFPSSQIRYLRKVQASCPLLASLLFFALQMMTRCRPLSRVLYVFLDCCSVLLDKSCSHTLCKSIPKPRIVFIIPMLTTSLSIQSYILQVSITDFNYKSKQKD